jgi:uncharacterized membrane protein YhiD involved in acid resistance
VIAFDVALLRLGAALLFGALIGIERQWRHKTAGVKTNALVAIGAAGFAIVSNTFGSGNHNPGQIAAAVVSGIGFIGAGVIIHRGATVQGVTTAATLWATASMGVAIGIGQYTVGGIVVAGVVFVQLIMRRFEAAVKRAAKQRGTTRIDLIVECDEESLDALNAVWNAYVAESDLVPLRRVTSRRGDRLIWRTTLLAKPAVDLTPFEERAVAVEGVTRVDARHADFGDEVSGGL